MGDPCGGVGNGAIHESMMGIATSAKDFELVAQRLTNLDDEMNDAKLKMQLQCGRIEAAKNIRLEREGSIDDWNKNINIMRGTINQIDKGLGMISNLAQLGKCSIIAGLAAGGDCMMAPVMGAMYGAASAIAMAGSIAVEVAVVDAQVRSKTFNAALLRPSTTINVTPCKSIRSSSLRISSGERLNCRLNYPA